MVKDSVDELIPMVKILVNLSLQTANVPDSMKQALVTPLLKKDDLDPEVLKNYRPVSNLSFLSKVLERVVEARLTNYMTIKVMGTIASQLKALSQNTPQSSIIL